MTSKALILGATGGIGGETARQLQQTGWQINALTRRAQNRSKTNWIVGDALDPKAVSCAAQDCQLIMHAVNPPGYRDWDKLVLPMLENTLAAARQTSATVVLPGTLYNYGADVFPLIDEAAPQHPTTRKGQIRVKMEQRLRRFAEEGGRVIIVRAGDYFGPHAGNNWLAQGFIKPGRAITTIANPARVNIGHQWGYLPDVAATITALVAIRERLQPFENVHMAGHWDDDGRQMVTAICRVVKKYQLRTPKDRAFPWWLMRLLAPFQTTLKELLEMQYLWQQPVQLSNARLLAVLGSEPHTPLEHAVEQTLLSLGCLPSTR
jgi:nucleoside-diphosphate-sugar epimerase